MKDGRCGASRVWAPPQTSRRPAGPCAGACQFGTHGGDLGRNQMRLKVEPSRHPVLPDLRAPPRILP